MIVVGIDGRAMQRLGRDPQSVGPLVDLGAELPQFGGQGRDAIGFLVADVCDVANRRRPLGERAAAASV